MTIQWNITGTPNQQAIVREAFARIKFPFDRLTTLPGTPELGWRNLNPMRELGWPVAKGDEPKLHEGHHPGGEDKPDSLEGELEGRRWVMGVIYTQSGRIYLDYKLEQYPELAMGVVGAEIAHAVDFFLPMTDDQRNELLRLWNVPGTTWWEVVDYGEEYFRLGGEAFMHEFVAAYTDLQFGDKSAFSHDANVEPEDVRRILGIQRTDYVPPATFERFPPSKIFHKPSHYAKMGQVVTDITGLRPCKICKPQA